MIVEKIVSLFIGAVIVAIQLSILYYCTLMVSKLNRIERKVDAIAEVVTMFMKPDKFSSMTVTITQWQKVIKKAQEYFAEMEEQNG